MSQAAYPSAGVVARGPRWHARWALAAFLVTALVTRTITTTLRLRGAGTEGGLMIDGLHIHHMVFGLIILAVLTFMMLLHAGEGGPWGNRTWVPILFGVGWALVLDESALIISLADVYWEQLGDLSYWIMGAFALALLIAAIWGPEGPDASESSRGAPR